jgi:putative polymerase
LRPSEECVRHHATHGLMLPAVTKVITADQSMWLHFALIFGALSFNFFLCFIDTNVTGVSPLHVIATEILIISITLLVSFRSIGRKQFVLICATFLYLLILMLVRANRSGEDEIDPKVFRDFMIPFAFFLLGMRVRDLRNADSIVLISAALVTAIALFEYLFVDVYLRYFNIIMYYVARGSVATDRLEILSTNLFESGTRPEGRALFPVLGDHRVSSIFLEPVSPGNFAVILFLWAIVRLKFEKMLCAALFLMAIFLIIMADNRFGVYLCVSALGVFLLPSSFVYVLVACLPFVGMCALLGIAYSFEDFMIDNSFLGRLVLSGSVLLAFDLPTWFGIGGSARSAFDSGYGYVISQVGILGFAIFWFVFMTLKSANHQFFMFRSLTGLYLATVLCVSYSPFTIKTAALLWFLLGALAVAPEGRSNNQHVV